ncbi:MAG: alkene reductase [Planctomycetota bacterium]
MDDSTSVSPLLEPGLLGEVEIANRVLMAPMTRSRAGESRMPNALMAEYYAQRAGAGLIVSEGASISDEAKGWLHTATIHTDVHAQAWTQVVEAVHNAGSKMFCQLWHCGRASHSSFRADGSLPVAPSAIANGGEYIHTPNGKQPFEVPRALDAEELPRVVEDFRKAAERAKSAGFDGVEIHGANGYLIDEFLQSKTNHRTDDYGGSIENRYRLLKEIVEAVCTVYAPGRVAVRLSPNGVFNDMGSPDYREQFLYVAEQLNGYGLSYLHVMDGLGFGFHELGEPVTLADIRAVYKHAIVGNCGHDQASAEQAIRSGAATAMAFGRPYITNPDLVERFRNGWPLADMPDPSIWYSFDAEGYTDFPAYQAG